MKDNPKQSQSYGSAYIAWAAVAMFFFYQYILRVSPGVMVTELRQEFQLTAEQFATLGAFYLYSYSLLQIPLGIIVDRVGVKKTAVTSIILCGLGMWMIGVAEVFWVAKLSRILVGAGSASAFMCALKVIADRLPPGKRGLLMGATLAFGTIGPLLGVKPIIYLLETVGWRDATFAMALLCIPVLLFAFFFLPKHRKEDTHNPNESLGSVWLHLKEVVSNKRVMLYAFIAIGLYTPFSALADLWGTAFLMAKHEFPRDTAAQTIMTLYLGLAIGSIFLNWYCEKHNILNRAIRFCCAVILMLFCFVLYGPPMGAIPLAGVLLVLGAFCGSEMMCFTGAVMHTTPANSGLTIGVVNTLNMLGGAILQQLIGSGLDFQWTGSLDPHGVRIYNSFEFINALSILIVVITLCLYATLKLNRRSKNDPAPHPTF